MFGYVRPLKDELKVREFEQFKACYCALCHTLKTRYGTIATNILNYDFVFLAMLLWDEEETPEYCCARCVASPITKKKYCAPNQILEICAGYSIILAWWKLRDSVLDEGFFKSFRDRMLSLLLRGAYKKASAINAGFTEIVRSNLEELRSLEKAENVSLDACADKFAHVTQALALETLGDRYRALQQLLYHTGRYIYITDACDDLDEDIAKGRFNPVANRFGLKAARLTDEDKSVLRTTLIHSCGLIGTAFELLPENPWRAILSNIIYLGMPETCLRVLNGTWKSRKSPENKGMDKNI